MKVIINLLTHRLLIPAILLFATLTQTTAQVVDVTEKSGLFYFDAILFKSDTTDKARLDVYVMVPYATMNFVKSGDLFGAEFNVYIKIYNENELLVDSKTLERRIAEKNYFATQGGNADFDVMQAIFFLEPGQYEIEVIYFDQTGQKSYRRTRSQTVLDFSRYAFSLSGLMLVSSIEEDKGEYIITPFLSDNIGILSEYYFVFFESYKDMNTSGGQLDEVDYVYEYVNDKNETVLRSKRKRKQIPEAVNRHYLRIGIPATLAQGAYMLRVYALRPADKEGFDDYDVLATTERSVKNIKSVGGSFTEDITKAIKQLRYIATQDEMNYMLSPENLQERQLRFEDFWRQHDPTPNTERNEAYEDYYWRIDYANRNFKSYTEGWRTDMGKVFVIYGPPLSTDKKRLNDGRIYEKWVYSDKEIIFVDYNGFGDFRLYSPMNITDKYEYH
jgi:GWxTD domain-containing protein